ncbi:MAG: S-layer homology domain-containing protein, partial [Oscillospiraceae bacterium]
TRAMLVTILYRLDSEPSVSDEAAFDDVTSGTWYADAVLWASSNNIVNGYGNGEFGPENNITREQIAAILYNYAQYKGYDVSAPAELDAFTDAGNTSDWAQASMKWAVANGLINGKGDGILDPTGTATRAEIAAMLMRFVDNFLK